MDRFARFVRTLESTGGNLVILIFLILLFLSASIFKVPNSAEILWIVVGGLLSAIKTEVGKKKPGNDDTTEPPQR